MRKLVPLLILGGLVVMKANAAEASICYQLHAIGGSNSFACDGNQAGTTGVSQNNDTLSITNTNGRSICYRTHSANVGWGSTKCDGAVAGTAGKYIQAVQIWYWNGDLEHSVGYLSHLQGIGWTTEVDDGAMSGTVGQSRRLEALKVFDTSRRPCPNAGYTFSNGCGERCTDQGDARGRANGPNLRQEAD